MRAAIFDMDGVLVDSEPLWRIAEQRVFATAGISLTDEMCTQTMGLRLGEVVTYWLSRYPNASRDRESLEADVLRELSALIRERAGPMPGATEALELCRRHGMRLGLASSSAEVLIDAVLDKLDLSDAFEVCRSAQRERYGKPHPAVYISTCDALGVAPEQCVAFEDSIPGLISACAASIRTVAIPAPELRDDPRLSIADLCLGSLAELDERHLAALWAPPGPVAPGGDDD